MTEGRAAASLAELEAAGGEIRAEDLPEALGRLEALRAALWRRMTTPPASVQAMRPAGPDSFLTTAEVCARLKVSPDWLYENAPRLRFACRQGRRWKFSAAGLEAYVGSVRRD